MKLTLPYPVSANRYWHTVTNRKTGRAMTFVSTEAKSYKSEVGWIARAAGARCTTRPIVFHVKLVPKNAVCMDLDNALKVTIDALKGVLYEDDSQIRRIIAERADADGNARLEIEVVEFSPEAPPLFADAPQAA